MKIERFEDIDSWKEARELVKEIYCITGSDAFRKDYGLKDQIQRAGVSIMANISEGFDSGSNKSFINFLNYSYRSTSEVQSLLYIALDQNYISKTQCEHLYNKSVKIKSLIAGFKRYLETNLINKNRPTLNVELNKGYLMDKRKYSVIVFDLGNVLIPFDYNKMIDRLNEVKEGLGKRFIEHYKLNYHIHRSLERGDLKEDDFIEQMLEACERTIDRETFCKYYSEIFTENEKVTALLPKLKEKYMLVLLSNTNGIHREYGYKQYKFLDNFDKLILSHEAGAVKPEPEIYRAVESYTGLPAAEHIFIDDVADYAEGARKMGWDAIQFKSYEQLVDEFKERGIL